MQKPSIYTKKRSLAVLCIFGFLIFALIIRVGWIQVVRGSWLTQKAFEQQNSNRKIMSKRGAIYDRNGKELAVSASADKIIVSPQEMKKSKIDIDLVGVELSQILEMKKEDILEKISRKSRYEVIKTKVDKEIGDKVRKWKSDKKVAGIYVDEDTKRYYPNKNLAAHVIGFVGEDNQGLDGIEIMAEKYLKGAPGKILSEVDAGGHEVPFSEEKRIEPQDGLNITLTIDETIQYITQKVLEKAIDDNKLLNGATAVVMDPRTGEILALVSKPDYDLNNPKAPPPDVDPTTWKANTSEAIKKLQETVWRNKAVTDTYEPGSTFKAFTSAAGLEENVVTKETQVSDSTITVQGKRINCWKPNAHGTETFVEGVYNSCNPVFVKVAQDLGISRFYKYMRAFGFFEKTGITLPGEARSIFHKKPKEIDMAVASFGQRFQITPIQLVAGYSAVANGGKLLKPIIIKQLSDSKGTIVKKFEPEVLRNVISKKTSDTLREILEGVVSEGTGKNAYVKGYKVAGKTGTSETTVEGRYIASFAAFAPADNPVISVLVVLDNPSAGSYYGGVIAAPVAGKLIEDVLTYMGVERRYSERDKVIIQEDVYVPDLENKNIEEARKLLKEYGLDCRIEGVSQEAVITDQTPKAGVLVPKNSVIILYTGAQPNEKGVKVPDVTKKSVSEAKRLLNEASLNIKVNGLGEAVGQSIKPGQIVPQGSVVSVEFKVTDVE